MTVSNADVSVRVGEGVSKSQKKHKGESDTKRNWLVESISRVGFFRGCVTLDTSSFADGPMGSPSSDTLRTSSGTLNVIHVDTFPVDRREAKDATMISRAETRAIAEEKDETLVTLRFQIRHHVEFGDSIYLVGSTHELGRWDIQKAVPLVWSSGDVWTVSVDIRRVDIPRLEYKYTMRSQGGEFTWEKCSNRYILKTPSREMTLVDLWEFPGYNPGI
jgi:hypothetical protein